MLKEDEYFGRKIHKSWFVVGKQESWVINFSLSTARPILFNACPVESKHNLLLSLLDNLEFNSSICFLRNQNGYQLHVSGQHISNYAMLNRKVGFVKKESVLFTDTLQIITD